MKRPVYERPKWKYDPYKEALPEPATAGGCHPKAKVFAFAVPNRLILFATSGSVLIT